MLFKLTKVKNAKGNENPQKLSDVHKKTRRNIQIYKIFGSMLRKRCRIENTNTDKYILIFKFSQRAYLRALAASLLIN
jgi:hypothetical protein